MNTCAGGTRKCPRVVCGPLLSAEAQRFVWLELTPELPEIDFDGLYTQVADAWRLMHDWQLSSLLDQFDDNENHRLFRDWSQLYLRGARQRGWITESEVPAAIELAVREGHLTAEPLLMLGFDVVPPSVERMLDAYRSAGAAIHRFEPAHSSNAQVLTASCGDAEQELRAAIHWAKSALAEAQEPSSICIAVPNLVESHDRVVRQLDAILRPDDAEPSAATSPYNVSGGVPLSLVPVVADALDFLDWLFEPFHHTRVDALLRSPFLQLAPVSAAEDERLPEWGDASHYAALTSGSPLREIVRHASRAGLLDLEDAVAVAKHLLRMAGWPEVGRLSSESYQAYRSFEALFDELAANSNFVQPRHFAATIGQLRLAADRRLFAPERPRAAIQVLGYLETIGLEFTHLWITGLTQLDWPGSPSPTPFIPMRYLRAAAVARSDVGGEVAFARRLMAHWRASSGSLVLSHPVVRNDVPCRGSTLLQELHPSAELQIVGPERDTEPSLSRWAPRTVAGRQHRDRADRSRAFTSSRYRDSPRPIGVPVSGLRTLSTACAATPCSPFVSEHDRSGCSGPHGIAQPVRSRDDRRRPSHRTTPSSQR